MGTALEGREGEERSWTQGVGVGGTKRLGEGRGGSEDVQNLSFKRNL